MESALLFILLLAAVALVAGIGAAGGAWLTLRVAEHVRQRVVVEVEARLITARVTAPAEVKIPVRLVLPELDPVTVPIVTAPVPSTRELAEKVLAETPEIGARGLARIVGCAVSTAHGIITDYHAARGTAPTASAMVAAASVAAEREELGVWPPRTAEA
jgi:hypothetical protein